MENLIPILNKLQDVFATVGADAHSIDLPQIVVVGCQSAGKSSVLEAIVQKDFLPRGSGICTRRPLILQLIHIPADSNPKEWGEFVHAAGQKFTDFNKIRLEIEAETNRVCGSNKGVTDKPINLKVFSPNVLNLTLVDLPGLTKVAVEDQPKDIPEQIDRMVNKYIEHENAIILAITPANQDLANSDSLIAARKVDPKGDRTLGVLTKLDIMDKGTDARDVLLNRVYALKLGYIGVINRSQQDINSNVAVAKAAAAERKFFQEKECYRDLAHNCGTAYLAQQLNALLMRHIKDKLPGLQTQISNLLAKKRQELKQYGTALGETIEEKQLVTFGLVSKFVEQFVAVLNGSADTLSWTKLDGGSTVISVLIDEFPQKMLEIPSVKELSPEKVQNLMTNQSGMYRSMFFPEATYHTLVKGEIKKLTPCVVESVKRAQSILVEILIGIKVPELDRFPDLRDGIIRIAQEVIARCTAEATAFAQQLLDIQLSYINTDHPDFKGLVSIEGGQNWQQVVELTHRYYVIVRKEIIDTIPKAIYRTFFVKGIEQLRLDLVEHVVLKPYLNEDPKVATQRRACENLVKALRQASAVLGEVRKAQV
jgi:replication fork clamp-binding protein CrfC